MAMKRYYGFQWEQLEHTKHKKIKPKRIKPESKEAIIDKSLIALRRKNLNIIDNNDRLKRITVMLNNRIRKTESSKVSDIVNYWISNLS